MEATWHRAWGVIKRWTCWNSWQSFGAGDKVEQAKMCINLEI